MNISVIASDSSRREQLQQVLASAGSNIEHDVTHESSLGQWLARTAVVPRPVLSLAGELSGKSGDSSVNSDNTGTAAPHPALTGMLILDVGREDAAALDTLAKISSQFPQLTIVMMSENRAPALLTAAMQAGVREVLAWPPVAAEIAAVLERARQRGAGAARPATHGKVLGFIACKGGSGATFIAANLGYALAVEQQRRVLLIDLNLQYGDASFFFFSGQQLPGSIASVVRRAGQMDAMLLEASCIKVAPNLHVLPAPDEPAAIIDIEPEGIKQLLALAATQYDYVLVDMDRAIDIVSLAALDQADTVFAIMQSMVPDMRDARTLLRAFNQLGYADSKLQFIVNRGDKKEDAPARPIERGLGIDFYRTIPNDYFNASASVNQGVSILELAPASPVSKALREIATEMTGVSLGRESWFRRVLRRA
jgi:pilus assembly protein CpaE